MSGGEVAATVYVGAGRHSKTPETALPFAGTRELADLLNERLPRHEDWFSLNSWDGMSRTREKKARDCFLSSWGVAVDIDQVEKRPLEERDATTITIAVKDGKLPGNVAYRTHGGIRLVFLFDRSCNDLETWQSAGQGANRLVSATLLVLGLAERFVVDAKVTTDAKRIFYTPKAIVPRDAEKGGSPAEPRRGRAIVVRAAPYTVADLVAEASTFEVPPVAATGSDRASGSKVVAVSTRLEKAAAEYRRANPLQLGESVGTCPGCGHNDCAHTHPDNPERGVCFSTGHDPAVHGGRRVEQGGVPCVVFDALDVCATRAGLTVEQVLRREGLLDTGESRSSDKSATASTSTGESSVPPTLRSDLMNGERLAAAARGDYLYVHGWNTWLRWDGKRWAADSSRSINELAGRVARKLRLDAQRATTKKDQKAAFRHAQNSQRRERIEAMIYVAATAIPDLKTTPGTFDRDEFAFNVLNGIVDLSTGNLRPHRREDRITKLAPVAFDPTATAPRWKKFLEDVLPDDATRAFVQRAIGYSATASVREHVLFLLYATGRNGKSTLLEVIRALFGDYAAQAAPDLLLAKRTDRHPTEFAALVGRRLVTSSEAGKGRAWDEARVKWLTGGDRLTARRMREDFFEFDPVHHFWVAVNHRPRVHGTDVGIWSRLKTIPFTQEFRDADDPNPGRQHLPVKDPTLKAKLLAELPGILNWVVEGCMAWQRQGLGEPETVRRATEGYRSEEDSLGPFLEAHGDIFEDGRCPLDDLAKTYRQHAESSGERPMSNRDFANELRDRGYTVKKSHGKRWVFVPTVTMVTPPGDGGDPVPMGAGATGLQPTRARGEVLSSGTVTDGHRVTLSDLTPLQAEMLGRLRSSPEGVETTRVDQFRMNALFALKNKDLAELRGDRWFSREDS